MISEKPAEGTPTDDILQKNIANDSMHVLNTNRGADGTAR